MDAAGWLEERGAAAPGTLYARMRAAVAAAADARAGGAVPAVLAGAGVDRLRAVLRSGQDRSVAADLLAADALLTAACEAAAERGPAALTTLLDAHGPARFAALLEEAVDASFAGDDR